MNHIIVGTAGHIDHGKTTLIKALTGRETDTLKEEKERGISINLGFTYFDLPSKTRVGIVDVPGHERFIKNMMTGAGGIDIVLLVIAADEGVMPQTMEHIDILSFLTITKGIVVITKADLVDEEILDLVKMDIEDHLQDTFLSKAPILEVDSVSKRGLDKLVKTLDEMKDDLPQKDLSAPTRMNIDRSFSLKGIGTIITGTLTEGTLEKDVEYEIYPSLLKTKLRSIQVHEENKDRAYAGQRVALNIPSLSSTEISRGDIIATPGSMEKARMIDVNLSLLSHTKKKVKHWDRLRLFTGSQEIFCRAVPLEDKILNPGESGLFQLRLEEELYCRKKDIFVLRTYSPIQTIGGGTIIDTSSKKHKFQDEEVIESLRLKEKGELKDLITEFVRENSPNLPNLKDLKNYTSESEENLKEELDELIRQEKIVPLSSLYLDPFYYEKLVEDIQRILKGFHKHNPYHRGMKKEEMRARINPLFKTQEFNSFLESLKDKGISYDDTIYFTSHKDSLSQDQLALIEKTLGRLERLGFTEVPKLGEFATSQEEQAILESRMGQEVILLTKEQITHRATYEKAKDLVQDLIQEQGQFTLADFRTASNSSRKITSYFLDYMDQEGFTKRIEDYRVLGKT